MKRVRGKYDCPVELSLDVLGGKWKTVIVARLKDGPLRYGELRALVPGLSDKMLTERLRDLQLSGLVEADVSEDRRLYRLTQRGLSLQPVLQALYAWGTVIAAHDGIALETAGSSVQTSG